MTARPRKHKFVVEITDMELGLSNRQMRTNVAAALEHGLFQLGYASFVANVQVKDANRVMQHWKRKRTRTKE